MRSVVTYQAGALVMIITHKDYSNRIGNQAAVAYRMHLISELHAQIPITILYPEEQLLPQ